MQEPLQPELTKLLASYVYVYIDPRDNEIFYIGKGKDDRLIQHLNEKGNSPKNHRIAEIKAAGYIPKIELLRYSLTDQQAQLVEAAAIDLLGKSFLTNQVAGKHAASFGRITLDDLMLIATAKKVEVKHSAMLITINQLFRSNMSELELYEATRGIWRVGKNREKVEMVLSVYQGIVREVYRPARWIPAGTSDYETRKFTKKERQHRWEFEGRVAHDLRDKYVGFSVGKSGQNPIRYLNI